MDATYRKQSIEPAVGRQMHAANIIIRHPSTHPPIHPSSSSISTYLVGISAYGVLGLRITSDERGAHPRTREPNSAAEIRQKKLGSTVEKGWCASRKYGPGPQVPRSPFQRHSIAYVLRNVGRLSSVVSALVHVHTSTLKYNPSFPLPSLSIHPDLCRTCSSFGEAARKVAMEH